jgi:hypothetical protein
MTSIEPAANEAFEHITCNDKPLAYIIRAEMTPEKTTFLTPLDFNLQLGFIVYPANGSVARHAHWPLERNIVGTSEVLIIKKGRCEIDVYNDDRELVATRELRTGDIMMMIAGGHGFRMLEDTILIEIKQGPYTGMDEKETF